MKVAIIDYGAGNTQSVKFALQRLGVEPVLSDDAEELASADKIIFPGVGHARTAMKVLNQKALANLIPTLKQPVLGICLGMQLMCKFSQEGETVCLGIFDEQVKLFEPKLKVPHTGWNQTITLNDQVNVFGAAAGKAWYYFVHSYYIPINNHSILSCDYIVNFSAAIQKDNFYAVQFHPEKSGDAGESILREFLKL